MRESRDSQDVAKNGISNRATVVRQSQIIFEETRSRRHDILTDQNLPSCTHRPFVLLAYAWQPDWGINE